MSAFDDWFGREKREPDSAARLFCLPHSGAGASAFAAWRRVLQPEIDVVPLHLPGREERIGEPGQPDPEILARAISTRIDRPYAVYGHSVGGRLGFEVLRALRRLGAPAPVRFYPAASRPPQIPDSFSRLIGLDDEELVEALIARYGAPAHLRAEPELRATVLPVIRSDMRWLADYTYVPGAPLDTAVTVLFGEQDPSLTEADTAPWAEVAERFASLGIPGGHLFHIESAAQVAAFLKRDLVGALDRVADERREPDVRAHLVELVHGQWSVWHDVLIRSAGFPVDGLALFSAPELADAADAMLFDGAESGRFADLFDVAVRRNSTRMFELAGDPLLREAVVWQNRGMMVGLDGLVRAGREPRRASKHRVRERALTRYWQRYCGKAETVGFFGPVTWARIDPKVRGLHVTPGPGLVRHRQVFFDHWPLEQLGRVFAADPAVRRGLPPVLQPHLVVRDRSLIHPSRPAAELSAAEAAVLGLCDGRMSALHIAEALIAQRTAGMRSVADVELVLEALVRRGVVHWSFDLPVSFAAEDVLRARIEALEPGEARSRVLRQLSAVTAARDEVGAAAGDPAAVGAALTRLDEVFRDVTGDSPTRRAGQAYAGRTVCVEETSRDLDVIIGTDVLGPLNTALAVPLAAARWFCGALHVAYRTAIHEVCANLADELGHAAVPLGHVWFLAQSLFYGEHERPCDEVRAELAKRWAAVVGLDGVDPHVARLELSADEALARAAEFFPNPEETWSAAVLHSPDILLAAQSAEAVTAGRFAAVLGELHVAWATAGTACFLQGHEDVPALREALRADLGTARMDLLLPLRWPRRLPRLAFGLEDRAVAQLGFEPAPGADPGRLVPLAACHVARRGRELAAVADDGREWPLLEVFARPLSEVAVETFTLASDRPHLPRISIDRLTVARESWSFPTASCPVLSAKGESDEYLAVRRWRRDAGLPEQVFVKCQTETKPFYADLSSPAYTAMFAAALRAAHLENPDSSLTLTELLPEPGHCWLPDGSGRRYVSELRLHVRDEHAARLVRRTAQSGRRPSLERKPAVDCPDAE